MQARQQPAGQHTADRTFEAAAEERDQEPACPPGRWGRANVRCAAAAVALCSICRQDSKPPRPPMGAPPQNPMTSPKPRSAPGQRQQHDDEQEDAEIVARAAAGPRWRRSSTWQSSYRSGRRLFGTRPVLRAAARSDKRLRRSPRRFRASAMSAPSARRKGRCPPATPRDARSFASGASFAAGPARGRRSARAGSLGERQGVQDMAERTEAGEQAGECGDRELDRAEDEEEALRRGRGNRDQRRAQSAGGHQGGAGPIARASVGRAPAAVADPDDDQRQEERRIYEEDGGRRSKARRAQPLSCGCARASISGCFHHRAPLLLPGLTMVMAPPVLSTGSDPA